MYIYNLGIEANAAEGALSLTLAPSGSCFRPRGCRDQPEIVEPVSGSALLASSRETEMNRETWQRIKRFLLTCNSFPLSPSVVAYLRIWVIDDNYRLLANESQQRVKKRFPTVGFRSIGRFHELRFLGKFWTFTTM